MGSVYQLAAMGNYGPGWELYWELDMLQAGGSLHGEIVVRLRPEFKPQQLGQVPERGHEVCRMGWPHHLHRPAEPLHESLVAIIGNSLVAAIKEAHAAGRVSAMADLRGLIGAETARGRW